MFVIRERLYAHPVYLIILSQSLKMALDKPKYVAMFEWNYLYNKVVLD